MNLTKLGRYFFSGALVASGVQQLIIADFVRLVPKLPGWIPWHPFWACLIGVVLIVAGVAIAAEKRARPAALALGALLLLSFLLQRVPEIAANPGAGFMWTNPCKILALWGGTLLLAGIGRVTGALPPNGQPAGKLMLLAPALLGVFLLVCGVQHFVYADFVAQMVPGWIPAHRFWTCFTGAALIAGGAGVMLPPTARAAATLSGLMIFLWVPLLHLPRASANLSDAGETSAVFEALALSGVAFLVAGSRTKDGH